MYEYDNFEQLRNEMRTIFERKEGIPEDVKRIIQQMFNKLEQEYKKRGCYSTNIKEYIDGNLSELMAHLKSGIGNRRKEEQMEDIQIFLHGVQKGIEENLDSEEQKREDDNNKKRIGEISNNSPSNIRKTLNTMDLIEEYLRDIQSAQNRMLYSRKQYSDRQISELNDQMKYFIKKLRSDNENNIHNGFQKDNQQLRQELLRAFEEYIDRRGEKEHTEQNDFRKSLDVKDQLPLGIQRDNSERFLAGNVQEQDQESLAVDELPESTL